MGLSLPKSETPLRRANRDTFSDSHLLRRQSRRWGAVGLCIIIPWFLAYFALIALFGGAIWRGWSVAGLLLYGLIGCAGVPALVLYYRWVTVWFVRAERCNYALCEYCGYPIDGL